MYRDSYRRYAGGLGIRRYADGGLGWFALPTYINPETGSLNDVLGLLASVMLSCTVTFIITYLTYKDEVVVETEGDTQHVSDNLVSGIGKIVSRLFHL